MCRGQREMTELELETRLAEKNRESFFALPAIYQCDRLGRVSYIFGKVERVQSQVIDCYNIAEEHKNFR